jgi:hypothetical protein
MALYTIFDYCGEPSKTFFLEICLKRVVECLDSEATYQDINGVPLIFTEDAFQLLFEQQQTLHIVKSDDVKLVIRVEKKKFKCVSEVGGIFSELPSNGSFTINGQICDGFNVGNSWEFRVKDENGRTGLTVCSHQEMLDAYKHNGCWHVRWQHPFLDRHYNFIFDFTPLRE